MKLVIFSPYYPPHIGGLETHADEFNKYMSPYVEKIIVFTPRLPFDAQEKETLFGNVEVIRFPAFEVIPNYPIPRFWKTDFWNLFFDLYRVNPDIVISRTRFFLTSLLALFYAKTKRIKWVHIEHGSDFVKLNGIFASSLAKAYDHSLGKLVLSLSDINIANSKASAEFCKRLAARKKCEVIYRGVEIEKIERIQPNHALRRKYGRKKIITFIGRLIDGKGVHDLLRSVKDAGEDFILFIIGDGPQRKHLEELTERYKIKDRVIFFGQKKSENAISILKISDIFVNPSYTEGLPTSVIEAVLCHVPVIATNVGGTPEISKQLKLVNPGDSNEITSTIKTLCQNSDETTEILESANIEVVLKFDWKESIEKYVRIFNKVREKKIIIMSSRGGGPYRQYSLISKELTKNNFDTRLYRGFLNWIKLHLLYKSDTIIITNVPFLFRLSRKNFFLHIKGNYLKERNLFKNPLGYLYPLNTLWSQKIIVPCIFLKNVLSLNASIIIPNAVDDELICSEINHGDFNAEKIRLITITKFFFLEKATGVINILECLSALQTKKEIEFYIFGYGPHENKIKNEAKKISLPKNVRIIFCGKTNNPIGEMRKSDIFLYWSSLDVMPNVLLEAMAVGIPIISNDFPSFREILGSHNLISKTRLEFTRNLERLIHNPAEIKHICEENKSFSKRYALSKIIKSWINIITK